MKRMALQKAGAQLDKMTQDDARILMIAAALRGGMASARGSISSVILDEDDGRAWVRVIVVRGVAAIAEMDRAIEQSEGFLKDGRLCRYCGCTDAHACPGGCSWIARNVCSHPKCIEQYETDRAARKAKRVSRKAAKAQRKMIPTKGAKKRDEK